MCEETRRFEMKIELNYVIEFKKIEVINKIFGGLKCH